MAAKIRLATKYTEFQRHYGTVGDLCRYIRTTPRAWVKQGSGSENTEWTPLSVTQACDLAEQGWPEGREKMRAAVAGMSANTVAVRPSEMMDVAGAYPLVPEACAGNPACMVNMGTDLSRSRPIVRIIVANRAASAISDESIIRRGAAILSVVDRLESSGYSCDIEAGYFGHNNVRGDSSAVRADLRYTIKRAGEPLDIDRTAFALVHPAMLRRMMFYCLETHPELQVFSSGYGMPHDELSAEALGESIYFPRLNGKDEAALSTDAGADAWVRKIVERSPYAYLLERAQ